MADFISIVNGNAEAAFANRPAWHGLGKVYRKGESKGMTSQELIESGLLQWQVGKEELTTRPAVERWLREHEGETITPELFEEVPNGMAGYYATVRQDTFHPLGVVKDRYEVIQNAEGFKFLDGLLQDGIIEYESAFALKGGRQVVLVARLPSVDTIAEGDICNRYITWNACHDGTGGISCYATSLRQVCWNTVSVAFGNARRAGQVYTIRHTGDVKAKIEIAKQYLSQFDEQFTLFRQAGEELSKRPYRQTEMEEFLKKLFPPPPMEEERKYTIWKNQIGVIGGCISAPAQQLPSIQGSWWSLFNGITAYVDHESRTRGKTQRERAENRYLKVMGGAGSNLKTKALETALEMAGVELAA